MKYSIPHPGYHSLPGPTLKILLLAGPGFLLLIGQRDCTSSGEFDALEPIGPDRLLLMGDGNPDAVAVTLNGIPIDVLDVQHEESPARTYLTLAATLSPGVLVVETGNALFSRTLVSKTAVLSLTSSHVISDLVYGMAFPPDAEFVNDHGVSLARWGGNATSLYNPFLGTTQAGLDWFFENRASETAESWLQWLHANGTPTFFSVPALDYVARDSFSYSYSVQKYGEQQETDPWNPDAGNGVLLDGTHVTWNDPLDGSTPFSPTMAGEWLATLEEAPAIAAVDNELDIAGETHRDVHPEPSSYEELRDRFLATSDSIRGALPGTAVAGPSSCCWWFYWNSAAGSEDKAAHGGVDFLPWFLDEIAQHDQGSGTRSLHILDLHYYPDGVFNDQTDPQTQALRLRSTRSLWDPTYTDEGWIGDDIWATQTQPNPNEVMLIPRFKTLISQHYPGTGLAIGEWNWGAEEHISGGLAVADVLGILGREGLDVGTYWTSPPAGSPAAEAFRLYRGTGSGFGNASLPVSAPDPDLLGAYAAARPDASLTLVVVNKDPFNDLILTLSGGPALAASIHHFSAQTEGKRVSDPETRTFGTVVVPAYGAIVLGQL